MSVKQTFFWYDLETSGTNPRNDRVMQFAGQRTTLDLKPVGEPVNVLIKLTPDILPEPDAVLITGITPQMTLADGVTEAEFMRMFAEEVATPGTIFVGYNSVRFDDEFMRFMHWRNFYDAYAWQWKESRSRWDLLDVVRMTRALRPEGIKWPLVDGRASNRLELLTKENGLLHESAHDALSDVQACIEVARLIRQAQPKLFDYLLEMRNKKRVAELINRGEPFVYTSGKYDGAHEKTTIAVHIADNGSSGALVYDLRHDPSEFVALSPEELVERWRWTRDESAPKRLPVKTVQFNRCPAVAPLSVLDGASQARLSIDVATIAVHRQKLREYPEFIQNVIKAVEILDQERSERWSGQESADTRLYDGFVNSDDQTKMSVLRAASSDEVGVIASDFRDERLKDLAPLYKARNFRESLTDEERSDWETHCYQALMEGGAKSRLAVYMHRLGQLAQLHNDADVQYILQELQLYAESIMPASE